MKSISIQFHATLNELIEYATNVLGQLELNCVLVSRPPFCVEEVQIEDLSIAMSATPKLADLSFFFTRYRPNLGVGSYDSLIKANSGAVIIDIGKLIDKSLCESGFSFMSGNSDEIELAKKMASKLKRITKAGVIGINPDSGAEAPFRTHRFTEGARLLEKSGIKILPIAGKCLFRLHD